MKNIFEVLGKGIIGLSILMLFIYVIVLIQNHYNPNQKTIISPFYIIIALLLLIAGIKVKNLKL